MKSQHGEAAGAVATDEQFVEIEYVCSRERCKHKQTIRFFTADDILPVTCCVACRAGFGTELRDMIANHIGMFPVFQK